MDTHLLLSGLKQYPKTLTPQGIFHLANEDMAKLKEDIFVLQVVSIDTSSMQNPY